MAAAEAARDSPRGRAAPVEVGKKRRGRRDDGSRKKKKRDRSASSSSAVETPPRKKKKGKKKGADTTSSSSSSSSSGSSSESGESREESDEDASSPGSGRGGRKKKAGANWTLLNDIWPLEERPKKLQDKRYVSKLSWPTIMALQDRYEKEAEKKGVGSAIYGKDRKLRKIRFKARGDDGYTRLHRARWLRLPMAAPDKYWARVPRAHEQRFRHLQLAHYGVESQINEKVILSLHDRQVRMWILAGGGNGDGSGFEAVPSWKDIFGDLVHVRNLITYLVIFSLPADGQWIK